MNLWKNENYYQLKNVLFFMTCSFLKWHGHKKKNIKYKMEAVGNLIIQMGHIFSFIVSDIVKILWYEGRVPPFFLPCQFKSSHYCLLWWFDVTPSPLRFMKDSVPLSLRTIFFSCLLDISLWYCLLVQMTQEFFFG